jgi:hypothetical protein
MTVSSETKRADYTGNGSTTNFATVFRFLQNSDVKVILTVTATGTETVQTETTNYTLVGAGLDGGGTVTMLVAPPSGTTLTIKRDVPLTQGTDYVENDAFPAESHERALDKLTMITQQMQEELDRSLKLQETDQSAGLLVPSPDNGKLLRWDADDNLENVSETQLGTISENEITRTFDTVALMKSSSLTSVGGLVRTKGNVTAGDGGGATYLIKTSAAFGGTPDGFGDHTLANGNVAVLQVKNRITAAQFGVVNTGVDTLLALDAFLERVSTGTPGKIDRPGTYGLSDGVGFLIDADFDLEICAGAEIKALAGFPGNTKLIQIADGTGTDQIFKWIGGSLDGENMPNSGVGEANDMIYFTAAASCSSVVIHLDRTFTGEDWRTAGSDSHVFAVANNVDIDIKEAIGAWDLAVYISGDSVDSSQGTKARVRGNYYKCLNAVAAKRNYQDIDIDIFTEDCLTGAGYADDASVGGTEVIGGDGGFIKVASRRTERSAFIQGGGNVTLFVDAVDLGVSLTGGTPYTSAGAQAANLEGCDSCTGVVNAHGVNSALTKTSAFKAVNMGDRTVDVATVLSLDNKLLINCAEIGTALTEAGGSDRNSFEIEDQNPSAAPSYVGPESNLRWNLIGREVKSYGGALSNVYTAGVQEVTEVGAETLLKEYVSSVGVQWLIRNGGSIPARFAYTISTGVWEFRAGGSGVIFTIDENGPAMPPYTVAGLPSTGRITGAVAYASDGRKAGEGASSGTGVLVFFDGTNWIAVDSGATVLA